MSDEPAGKNGGDGDGGESDHHYHHDVESSSSSSSIRLLREAINANLALQSAYRSRLLAVLDRKSINRNLSSAVSASLMRRWDLDDATALGRRKSGLTPQFYRDLARHLQQQKQEEVVEKEEVEKAAGETEERRPEGGAEEEHADDANGNITKKRKRSSGSGQQSPTSSTSSFPYEFKPTRIEKRWKSDPKRKWNRRFFVDPDGSIPGPNDDVVRRRTKETDDGSGGGGGGGVPYPHLVPPWSKSELDALRTHVEDVRRDMLQKRRRRSQRRAEGKKGRSIADDGVVDDDDGDGGSDAEEDGEDNDRTVIADADIDFNEVAARMRSSMSSSSKGKSTTKSKRSSSTIVAATDASRSRSADECRIMYLTSASPDIDKSAFTKAESLKILEAVHQAQAQAQTQGGGAGCVSWIDVAASLSSSPSDSSSRKRRRTPWQCFQHYQTNLNGTIRSNPWTPDEDGLLLRCVAAMGPGYNLNLRAASDLCRSFFPHRKPKELHLRAHSTLLNPKFVQRRWSRDEERRLALCMRVYGDAKPSPLLRASAHFPDRSTNQVSQKWQHSLNPEYSTEPFTKREDRDLLAAVKRAGGAEKWTVVSRQFPRRNPKTLMKRWTELASEADVAKKCGDDLVRSVARRGVVGREGALLSPDDFVVRVKRAVAEAAPSEARAGGSVAKVTDGARKRRAGR